MDSTAEQFRLTALADYQILDTAPEEVFDRLTDLAADLFDAPIAFVSLIDADRQWFKARRGIDAGSTAREVAFCDHAIRGPASSTFAVEDAADDPRFSTNPLVIGDPNIRFYAGAVLTGSDGYNLGTLCVIDTRARATPSAKDLRRLQTLARIVVDELELRRATRKAEERRRLLEMAEVIAGLGHWRLDAVTKAVSWSHEVYRIYGLPPGSTLDLESLMAMTHRDDLKKSQLRLERQLATGQKAEPATVRIIRPDGELRYLNSNSDIERSPSGQVLALVGTLIDVTDQKRIELELDAARAEAEKAAAVKSEFMANMSHELRTPLTSIIGFTRLAAEQHDLADLTRTYLERVSEASRALLCTVNDILDFSKLEAGQVRLEPEPVLLDKLGQATLDLFTPQAAAKDLNLILDVDPGRRGGAAMIDPTRIRQILLNLVGNAVKFTARGTVTLKMRHDPASQVLSVSVIDTGDGIAPDKQATLFKRFSQVGGSLARTGGAGLGLAICKGLVEAMGGEIGVESTRGSGSCFWFDIPAPATAAPHILADEVVAPSPMFGGLRVLVADDHPANRELARLYLAAVGAEVAEAVNGEEAVQLAMSRPFDVILMDVRMPVLDGPGALRRIREVPGPNDAAPIIAFTADGDDATAQRLAALGFEDMVSKPMDPALLMQAIARTTSFLTEPFVEAEHVG